MAITGLSVLSEREGVSTIQGSTQNLDNTNVAELYTLPIGFGDCVILGGAIRFSGISTAVANPELRRPVLRILGSTAGG